MMKKTERYWQTATGIFKLAKTSGRDFFHSVAITSGLTTAKAGEPAGSLELSGNTVTFAGDWTLAHYPALNRQVSQFNAENASLKPEISRLGRLDTAGASLMVKMLGDR